MIVIVMMTRWSSRPPMTADSDGACCDPDEVLPRADHAGDIQRVGIRHGCDNAVAMTLTLS